MHSREAPGVNMRKRLAGPECFSYFRLYSGLLLCVFLLWPGRGWALSPSEILVVANGNFPRSGELAKYYMNKEEFPKRT